MGIDPGAYKCGLALLDRDKKDGISLVYAGVATFPRLMDVTFSEYRRMLVRHWATSFPHYIGEWRPDMIISEFVPIVGGGRSGDSSQRVLAHTAITAMQAVIFNEPEWYESWVEIGASTAKKRMTGSGSATKTMIRNAVTDVFPELAERRREMTTYPDIGDAIAIGLMGCGYGQTAAA